MRFAGNVVMDCLLCEDTGWVCENHPDQPFAGPHACRCGGAGMPCPKCNPSNQDKPPRLPKGFEPARLPAPSPGGRGFRRRRRVNGHSR